MYTELNVLYRDADIIVAVKPFGKDSEKDMPRMLKEYLTEHGAQSEVYTVHRLDRETGGIMVYALNPKSAAYLSREIQEGGFAKIYTAEVIGTPEEKEGTLRDLLFRDTQKNKTYVTDRKRRGVKEAVLHYSVTAEKKGTSLLRIKLETGRTHQIRAQFSHRGHPVAGDRRYGGGKAEYMRLWAGELEFTSPDGRRRSFKAKAPFL